MCWFSPSFSPLQRATAALRSFALCALAPLTLALSGILLCVHPVCDYRPLLVCFMCAGGGSFYPLYTLYLMLFVPFHKILCSLQILVVSDAQGRAQVNLESKVLVGLLHL